MNEAARIRRLLIDEGLSEFKRYLSFYEAVVISNKDPENLARLQVKQVQFFGEEKSKWIPPRGMPVFAGGAGVSYLPPVGSVVFLTFKEGDINYPFWEYAYPMKANPLPEEANYNTMLFKSVSGATIQIGQEITITSGSFVITVGEKITITDGENNLGELISEYNDEISLLQVPTQLGPSGTPLNAVQLSLIIQKLLSILK